MQIENLIAFVKDLVDENGPADETFLVRFVSFDKVFLIQEFTSKKNAIHEAADEMFAEGGHTAILDAISYSAKYLIEKDPAGDYDRVIILVTDGDDRDSSMRIGQVVSQLKESNIRIFAVGIADLKVETKTLEKLTKETGGKIFLPKGAIGRKSAAKEVAAAIRPTSTK